MATSRKGFPVSNRSQGKLGSNERLPVEQFLHQAVDWGLAGVIFVAPLVLGGRHAIGRFVFVVLVAVTGIAWVAKQTLSADGRWRWSGAEWLIVAGVCLTLLQLMPLPPALLATLSPELSELLPVWTTQADSPAGLGSWSRLSLAPAETKGGLVMFVAYGMLFILVVQRIQKLSDVDRLFRWIAIAVTGMAALGVAQRFAGNGNFLWVYEDPFRDTHDAVKGAFINENHFAHFLALGIAPLLWWLRSGDQLDQTKTHKPPNVAVGLALALVAVAGLLTFSRGGVVVMFLAAAVCVAIYARAGLLKRNALAALAAVGVFVTVALLIHGYAPLSDELATLGAGSVEDVDRYGIRRQLWAADLTAASHFPLLGTGVASHAEISPVYFENPFDFDYTHTENSYLQLFLETGVVGLLLLLAGVVMCCRWCFGALHRAASPRFVATSGVVVVALTVSLVHSIWDFVWYLPACMSLTVILMACGCRLYQMSVSEGNGERRESGGARIARLQWAGAAIAVVAVSAMLVQDRLPPALAAPHWDRYLRQTVALAEQGSPSGIDESLGALIEALQQAVDRDPGDSRSQSRLANLLIRQFEQQQRTAVNSVSLQNLRETVLASRFPSRQAQDEWLQVAIGDSRKLLDRALAHTRRGLELSPLRGESYCDLAQLDFLAGRREDAARAHLEQALLVRPFSADVLFAVGMQAARSGDVDAALRYWKAPFNRAPSHRRHIIEMLAEAVPAAAFIEHFDPDTDALADLFAYYREHGRVEEAGELGRRYAALLEQSAASQPSAQAARQWLDAYEVHSVLNDAEAALRCISSAVKAAPDAYQPRLKLALLLIEHEQYGRAIEELNWCQRRKPQDQVVFNCLKRARVNQLRQAANTREPDHHRK